MPTRINLSLDVVDDNGRIVGHVKSDNNREIKRTVHKSAISGCLECNGNGGQL